MPELETHWTGSKPQQQLEVGLEVRCQRLIPPFNVAEDQRKKSASERGVSNLIQLALVVVCLSAHLGSIPFSAIGFLCALENLACFSGPWFLI